MEPTRRRAFTITEVLVVVAIIAVLLGLLLPAVILARAQSNAVVCASNLRQLYQAEVLYSVIFNSYIVPAEAGTGSATRRWWWGVGVLGEAFGFNSNTGSTERKLQVVAKIAKILYCPALNRQPVQGIPYTGDFCYNDNMGDIRGQNLANPAYREYAVWGAFKHANEVPGNVLMAIDAAPVITRDDDRFVSLTDLTTTSRTRAYPGASTPHRGKANMLFADGSVRQAIPSKDLAQWMIMAPGHLTNPYALFHTTNPNDVWQPGRPLPF